MALPRLEVNHMRAGIVSALTLSCCLLSCPAADAAPGAKRELDPKLRRIVDRGVAFLKKEGLTARAGYDSIAALGMLKAGESANGPEISTIISRITTKFKDGQYLARSRDKIYEAGADAMVLANADPKRYREDLRAIAQFLMSEQDAAGFWDYPAPKKLRGDTSMSQYALLGLWAAARAGVEVPSSVWSRAGAWYARTQLKTGAFLYRPGVKGNNDRFNHGLTAAGVGSLRICTRNLYPDGRRPTKTNEFTRRFGVLKKVDLDSDTKTASKPAEKTVRYSELEAATSRGIGWLTANFRITNVDRFPLYYIYSLERAASLAEIDKFGRHDWYSEGVAHLAATQNVDGSWQAESRSVAGTSFALMFIMRATGQVVGSPGAPLVGTGLMAGGRGLPQDFSQVQVTNGEVSKKELDLPIDKLLAQLENPTSLKVAAAAQQAFIEKVQFADAESLIGQEDRLIRLARDPRAEARRTAIWALGRSKELRVVPLLIGALEDRDLGVNVEARNALCWLSRRPRGFQLPENPLQDVSPDATPAQKEAAIKKWRETAVKKWRQWWLKVQPYDLRGLPEETQPTSR